MTSRWGAVAAVIVVVVAVSLARLAHLGDAELWFDEYLHVFAARSLAENGSPTLPSGEPYERGLELTRLVNLAQRHVSDPEAAARLPSAILGIGNVLIFAAIAWRIGGPWTAFWGALLLGTYPGALFEARNTRFYTEQLNLGLIAVWFGWLSVRTRLTPGTASVVPTWGAIIAAGVAFAAAAQVQLTTYSVAFAYAVVLAIAAAVDLRALGRGALRQSARLQAVLLGIVAAVVLVVARPESATMLLSVALAVPRWAEGQFSPKAYYWVLSEWTPLVLALLPAIVLVAAKRDVRLATYLGLLFAIPLALHSFVLRFQAGRYVLLPVAALLLLAAVAATIVCGVGYRAILRTLEQRGLRPRAATGLAAAGVFACAAAAVVTSPGFSLTRKHATGTMGRTNTDWRGAGEVLSRVPGSDTIPWGTANPLASLFYWGRADFTIYRPLRERSRSSNGAQRGLAGYSDRVLDYYSGVPTLATPAAIREQFGAKGAVLIAVDSAFYAERRTTPVFTTLRREALELCEGRCGPMRVYFWRFGDATRAGLPDPLGTAGDRDDRPVNQTESSNLTIVDAPAPREAPP